MYETIKFGAASCRLESSGDPDVYWLTCLRTEFEFQNRGMASRLLEICKFIAEQDGKVLRLWIGKFDRGLSTDQLLQFYQKHGFVRFDPMRPTYMEWRRR